MKHSILVVDDEIDNVEALERLFRPKYRVLKATSGDQGLGLLKGESVSLIISDQRMPHMTGVEFLEKSVQSHPDAMRILLTGYTDIESVIAAINSGQIYRYLTKPWDPVDLLNTVDQAIERFELREQLKEKNIALEKALSELKTLDESKNNFMILINHELKTPLTVILSFLQLLNDGSLTEEQERAVGRIRQASERLKTLVEDSLELVSAETGLKKAKFKKLTTTQVLDAITSGFQDQASSREQELKIEDPELSFKGDRDILRSVLSRLLDNAIKFGEKKSEIVVGAQALSPTGLKFFVTNRGKPIPSDRLEKIMKPFTLDEDIMHHSQGTGLGLSLCQALLKTHQSELSFEFSKGQVRVNFSLSGE